MTTNFDDYKFWTEQDEDETELIYNGEGYWIEQDKDGRIYFNDNMTKAELSHPLNDYSYIKYDENKGWIYKNGRELPWVD